jgi:four helix bundle protein
MSAMEADTSGRVSSYQDLLVWKAAMELAVSCYTATDDFPQKEAFGLTSQIRRSSSSVPANIAEGYGRENRGSFVQFLRISQGSLKELETHLILSGKVALLEPDAVARLLGHAEEVGKMLRALIRSLQRKR